MSKTEKEKFINFIYNENKVPIVSASSLSTLDKSLNVLVEEEKEIQVQVQ